MSNLETYREKALKCVRAAEEIHGLRERVELLGLASLDFHGPELASQNALSNAHFSSPFASVL